MFTTIEVLSRAPLDGVLVLPPPTPVNKTPKARPFSTARLESHLRSHLRKKLTEAQRLQLAQSVAAELARRLPKLSTLPGEGEGDVVLLAREVRRVVEFCLAREASRAGTHQQEHLESAHVLYAMTSVHRSITDVLELIEERYPGSAPEPIPQSRAQLPADYWYYSQTFMAPCPRSVVKNFRRGEPSDQAPTSGIAWADRAAVRERRPREEFALAKLELSIDRALGSTPLMGPQTMPKPEAVRNIREWILWSLAGQPVVRSSQLATLAAGVLRRCAPLAYLRWVTLGKELSVAEIYQEAASLLTLPSSPLVFDPQATPMVHRERSPQPM